MATNIRTLLSVIVLCFFTVSLARTAKAENWAIMISGGVNKESNFYRYYNNLKEMHQGLIARGFQRDHITTLYADGGGNGPNTNKTVLFFFDKYVEPSKSLQGDTVEDIKGPATSLSISKTFDELAKKIRPNDHILLFVTDHGSEYQGIVLWNGEPYATSELKKQINKLPDGVTVHVVTNICYGGQLQRVTARNVCVVSSVDDKHFNYSWANSNPFADGFAAYLKNKNARSNSKSSFLGAYQSAIDNDFPSNSTHMTSLDWFLTEREHDIELRSNATYCSSDSKDPLRSASIEIDAIINALQDDAGERRAIVEKRLQSKLNSAREALKSRQVRKALERQNDLDLQLSKLKAQYDSLSDSDKDLKRPEFTALTEKLVREQQNQAEILAEVRRKFSKIIRELKFLRYATEAEFEEYTAIRECLEYAL